MRRRMEQALLGPVYRVAVQLRQLVWRVRRPLLMGVRVLIVRDGAVLLVRHRAGEHPWSLPGGAVGRQERLIEAARRECREETGMELRIDRLIGVYDNFFVGVTNYVAVFLATPLGDPCPPRSIEIAEARFFSLGALPDGTEPGTIDRIAEYAAGHQGVTGLW